MEDRGSSSGLGDNVALSALPGGRVGGLGEDVKVGENGVLALGLAGVAPHVGLSASSKSTAVVLNLVVVGSRGSVTSNRVVGVEELYSYGMNISGCWFSS